MGQRDVEQVFLLSECIVGNDRGVTFGQVYAYQVGHIIAYQCEVRFVHFTLYRKKVDIFGLYAGANQFAGKAAHRSYLYSGSHRFAFYESKCLPPFAAAIRVAAAQRDEYGCHAVGQGFGQQVRGVFLRIRQIFKLVHPLNAPSSMFLVLSDRITCVKDVFPIKVLSLSCLQKA